MLGVLQYRWSKKISMAAAGRMRADLIRSITNFRQDFVREIVSVAGALEPTYSYAADFDRYAREFANWRRTGQRTDGAWQAAMKKVVFGNVV